MSDLDRLLRRLGAAPSAAPVERPVQRPVERPVELSVDPTVGRPVVLLPAGWVEIDPAPAGLSLVALEPASDDPPAVRASITITEISDANLSFAQWQTGSELILARGLRDFTIVDREKLSFDGHRAGRRRATYLLADFGVPVTIEQWFTAADGVGRTLTATCSSARHGDLVDTFYDVALSWRPIPRTP